MDNLISKLKHIEAILISANAFKDFELVEEGKQEIKKIIEDMGELKNV